MCGGSPLFWFFSFVLFVVNFVSKCRGEYTGEEMYIKHSRSPLSEPVRFQCWLKLIVSDVGEIHRVVLNWYSRSPLYEPES